MNTILHGSISRKLFSIHRAGKVISDQFSVGRTHGSDRQSIKPSSHSAIQPSNYLNVFN